MRRIFLTEKGMNLYGETDTFKYIELSIRREDLKLGKRVCLPSRVSSTGSISWYSWDGKVVDNFGHNDLKLPSWPALVEIAMNIGQVPTQAIKITGKVSNDVHERGKILVEKGTEVCLLPESVNVGMFNELLVEIVNLPDSVQEIVLGLHHFSEQLRYGMYQTTVGLVRPELVDVPCRDLPITPIPGFQAELDKIFKTRPVP